MCTKLVSFTDHLAFDLEVIIPRPSHNKMKTSSLKINDIDTNFMANEIKSKLDGIQYNSLSEPVPLYSDTLKSILDKYAQKSNAKPSHHINPGTTKT